MRATSAGTRILSRTFGFTILVLAFAARLGWAQVAASISGRVEDASNAGVAGATVTVKSLETGATRVVTSDESGNFAVLSLPLGQQEVKAEKNGFQPAVRTGISLAVGQAVKVNLRLNVGQFVQQVTVSEEAPVVNTSTAPVAGVVGQRQVKDLPLNGRSFDNLLTLNPGAVNYSAYKSAGTSTSNGNTFSVAGRRTYENLFLLNGIEDTGSSQLAISPGGVSGQLLGIEAVREFNVQTSAYSAEYGKRPGAQVSVVTQSGTNSLHGSLFEFLRNSDLDARNFFDQGSAPPFRRNQFGAAVGGPIKKDRLFVFANYEGFRQALAVSNVTVVPDQAARQGLLPNASGTPVPVANLNQAMLKYMSFWPLQNGPELLVNGLNSGTALSYNNPRQSIREDFGTLRTDYTIRDRDTLSAAYTIDDGNNLTPLADPLFGSYSTLRNQVGSVEETHILSPSALNTLRLGISRAGFNYDSFALANFPASDSFVSSLGPGGIVIGGGVTTTGASTITSAGPNNAANVWNRRTLFTYSDTFQFNKGKHQITAGVWFQRVRDNEDSASRQLGQASFASLQTFLQGTLTTFQVVPTPNELGWRSLFGAWFVEDAIRIRPNLTIQVGLRHEFTTGWNEDSGRAANYITNQGVLVTDPVVSSSVFKQNNAKRLLGPRLSLAWDPFRNGKTSVRAGFGTYFALIDDLAFLMNSIPPYNGSVSYSAVSLPSILPILPGIPPAPSCSPTVPQPCTTYAPQGIQPDAKTPTVQEWNLTVEQEVSRNTVLRVAYVGSFGYHGLLSVDPNSIPTQVCASATCTTGGSGTARGTVAQGALYIPVGTRPNPYLSGGFFWYTEGNSSYNALQLDVTRRLSHGLQFRANYTYAKNLDMNSGLTGAQANNQSQMVMNRNNLREDWGPAAQNIANQASVSTTYELPGGKSGSPAMRKLTGGWQLNAIATVLTGFPFTPQIGSNRSGDGDTRNPDRPSVNPSFSGPVLLQTPNQWFNPNAFILPTVGTYGNLGRATLNGPGLGDLDLSVFKNTAVSEKATLQFRAESFNLFNRANFGTPNAIVFSNGAISSTAGLITTTATTSRQIQFGLKLIF
ncbi:MAG TPA: TonB-dependent receptor [Bryobacteraceae bacterium]|nr:TonB-dependent receptor [Bryobacteraceae bacterium]